MNEQKKNNYKEQKKFLSTQKQLRVWVKPEKYELFKKRIEENGTSIYAVINNFIDEYIKDKTED